MARLRKDRGWTQAELADRIGIIQALVSDYERGELKLSAEMAVRFATALGVTTDELLGVKAVEAGTSPNRAVRRRVERIETLPPSRRALVLKALDAMLRDAERST